MLLLGGKGFTDAADAAYLRGSGIAAADAGLQGLALLLFLLLKGGLAAFQKTVVEVHFSSGHFFFQFKPQAFQRGEAGPFTVGAGGIVVFYTHKKSVVGSFKFRDSPERFYFSGEAVGVFQKGALIAEVGPVPAQGIAGEAGHFIVKVVAGGEHIEAALSCCLIEVVAFDFTAGGTDGATERGLHTGNSQALGGHIADDEGKIVFFAEAFHYTPRGR